jgi:hypothetical protein
MVIQLMENLRAAILLNTLLNTTAALCCFVMLVMYLRDTRWSRCVVLCCLLGTAGAAEPNYQMLTVKPKAERSLQTDTMSEVASLLSSKDWAYVQYDQNKMPVDDITKIHEGTHMLDASLSQPGWQGIYLGSGHAIRLKIPEKTQLSDIKIPLIERGKVYETYMVTSKKWWNANVLYTLVEANGYLQGAKVRRELGWTNRSETVRYGIELTSYFAKAIDTIEEIEPGYDTTALVEVLNLMTAQWRVIAPNFVSWPLAYKFSMHGKGYSE